MKKKALEREKSKENEQKILFTFDEILQKMRKSYPPVVENQDAIMWRFKESTRKDMNIIAKYAKEEGKRESQVAALWLACLPSFIIHKALLGKITD